jgi:hypothetical protein
MNKLAVYQDDELYLILRGKTYHLHGTFDGRRIRKSCGTTDLARAKLVLENHKRELVGGWREDYDRADRDWATVAKMVHDRQKHGALARGIPFHLKPAEVYSLMKSTGFRCAISGIPFAKRFAKTGERDPWAPSIDRIENRHGYTMDNVRVVSIAANIALSDWGLDVLLRLSRGIVRSSVVLAQEPEGLTHQLNNSDTTGDNQLIRLVK